MEHKTTLGLNFIMDVVLALPGVTEKLIHGTPGFYVGEIFFARMREDAKDLAILTLELEKWLELDSATF